MLVFLPINWQVTFTFLVRMIHRGECKAAEMCLTSRPGQRQVQVHVRLPGALRADGEGRTAVGCVPGSHGTAMGHQKEATQ